MEPSAEFEASGSGLSPIIVRVLAGLEVGVIGGLPAIAWLLFHSWLRGEPWWAKLNVAGAPFFGSSVYSMGFSRASLAGGALLVLGCGLLGVVFGLLARPQGVARNLVLGLLFAIAWQLACQQYLIRLLDTFAPAYYPPLSTLPAHLMFGIALARFGPRFQALAADWGDPSWAHVPEPPPVVPVEPSDEPSVETPAAPSAAPLVESSAAPSAAPLAAPLAAPPDEPSDAPLVAPLAAPSAAPLVAALAAPSDGPSDAPLVAPLAGPSDEPSDAPLVAPLAAPPDGPSAAPLAAPLAAPPDTPLLPPLATAQDPPHLVGPMPEPSSPKSTPIALSDGLESKESKRTQETDC